MQKFIKTIRKWFFPALYVLDSTRSISTAQENIKLSKLYRCINLVALIDKNQILAAMKSARPRSPSSVLGTSR